MEFGKGIFRYLYISSAEIDGYTKCFREVAIRTPVNRETHKLRKMSATGWMRDAAPQEGVDSSLIFGVLLVYIAFIPLKFQIRWILVRIQLVLFVLVALRVLIGLWRVNVTKTQLIVVGTLTFTFCATLIGQLVAVPGDNFDHLPQVSRFLVIGLVATLELNSVRRLKQILSFISAIAAVVSLLSIVNLFVPLPFAYTGQVRSFGLMALDLPRSLGIWMSFGSYGVLAVAGLAHTGMYALRPAALTSSQSSIRRALAVAALCLILISVILGRSRSTLIAIAFVSVWGFGVAAFHPESRSAGRSIVSVGILLICGILFVFNLPLISQAIIGANTASVSGRIEQYQYAVELMLRRPLLGWGWNYFGQAFGTSYTVHNVWLLVGVSVGVPVLLLWLYMFYRLGIDSFRLVFVSDVHTRAIGIVGFALFIGGVVELALYPGFTPVNAVLIGILASLGRIRWSETPTRSPTATVDE